MHSCKNFKEVLNIFLNEQKLLLSQNIAFSLKYFLLRAIINSGLNEVGVNNPFKMKNINKTEIAKRNYSQNLCELSHLFD